jgi:hypothetical protein
MGALESVGRMSDICARELEALRARSLDRHLREIKARRDCGLRFQRRTKQPSCGRWLGRNASRKETERTGSPTTECARTPSNGATDSALTPDFDRGSREHRPEHLPDLRPEAPVLRLACRARSHCWRTWPSGAARAFGWQSSSEKWSNKLGGARG